MAHHIPVEYPPDCPECGTELKPLDNFVVSWIYACPECKRGFQAYRSKETGWERVDAYFDFTNAPFPEYEELYDVTIQEDS